MTRLKAALPNAGRCPHLRQPSIRGVSGFVLVNNAEISSGLDRDEPASGPNYWHGPPP